MTSSTTKRVHGFCGFCIARCGTIATVENGRFTRLDPDPAHPTGAAICAKGRAAPELTYHPDRLTRPLRRTRPKSEADPGWREITWDEALDLTASAMRRIAETHGPHAVAFSQSSPSTTAIGEVAGFVRRLMNVFGTPNLVLPLEVCGWGRGFATRFAFGVGSVATGSGGGAMADIDNAGCLILWGYNPSYTRITHATKTVASLKRGMKLIVIDPRNVGLANKADVWLRVRPGTDGALALGLANIMIQRGWFDRDFVRNWSNAPLLVRDDTQQLLRATDLAGGGDARHFVAWNARSGQPATYDGATGHYSVSNDDLALDGQYSVQTTHGAIRCSTVFDHYRALCAKYSPDVVASTCWIDAAKLEEAARLIWHARPVAYYAWSGHEQHANTTETARAIALLYALTGSFDQSGGNVLLPVVPSAAVTGEELLAKPLAPAIGVADRPLGPARTGNVSALDFYRAVLEDKPYKVRGLIGFGGNLLLQQPDPVRGREALAALDFYAQADMFMTPSAALADVVLPVASSFEREALRIGFEIDTEAQSLVQLRSAVVPPPGEALPDMDVIFRLATRLGFADQFWNGDMDAAYRHQLAPSGVTLEQLRDNPQGIRLPLRARYAKYATLDAKANATGFATPSRKVEFWSETLREHGHSPQPDFIEPRIGPVNAPNLAMRFPLVLTCAKPTLFLQSQLRALPSLRKRAIAPEVELHPETAVARGIAEGSWVQISTPAGGARAKARFNASLDPRVVVGEHGWWQASAAAEAPGYDAFSSEGANFNLTIDPSIRDPISGTPSNRANLCEIRLVSQPR